MALKMATTLNINLLQTIEAIIRNYESKVKEDRRIASRLLQILADYAAASHNVPERAEIKALFEKVASTGEKIVEEYKRNGEFSDEQIVLSYLMNIYKSIGEFEAVNDMRLRQASSLVRQAESVPSYLLKSEFLESALRIYAEIGKKDKIEDLKSRVAHASEQSINEFKIIETTLEIPTKDIDDLIARYTGLSPFDSIAKIVSDENFVPRLKTLELEVEEIRKKNLISSIFSKKIIDDGLPRRTVTTDTEKIEYEIDRHFLLGVNISMIFLNKLLKKLEEGVLTKNALLEYLGGCRNIDPTSFALIDKALDMHFSKNYIGSIHILVCRIEPILRNLLKNHSKTPTKYDSSDKGMDFLLLGGLISDASSFIGEDLTKFLEVTLTQKGENIRNDICHGFIIESAFTEQLENKLIFIILKLANI